jgi:hypothetical protein
MLPVLESLIRSQRASDESTKLEARESLRYSLYLRSSNDSNSMRSVDSDSDSDSDSASTLAEASEAEDSELLQRVFDVRSQDVVHSFTAAFLHLSLLPARVLLTKRSLFIFASLEASVDHRSGYLRLGQSALAATRWCALDESAWCVFKSSDASELYKPISRAPFARMTHVSPLADDARAFEIVLREPRETIVALADSPSDAHSWIVSLRVAIAAARRRTVKRTIALSAITSVHSPREDVVFGADCITLTIGNSDERIWLSSVSDFDNTYRSLCATWLEQQQHHGDRVDSGGDGAALARVPSLHAYQSRFDAAFKLRNQVLRYTFSVSLVVNDYGVLARARIYLSDDYLCVRSSSIFKQLLAVVPWSAITQVEDNHFLMLDVGLNVFVRGNRLLGFVLPVMTGVAHIRHVVHTMWANGRVSALNDDLVFTDEPASAAAPAAGASAESPTAVFFHNARNKALHETFGNDIPIEETLQDSFECGLMRSDAQHNGVLSVTQHWFAFASNDNMLVVVPRAAVESAIPDGRTVKLLCSDGSDFVFASMNRLASFLRYVQGEDGGGDSGDAASASASASSTHAVHFYHNQLSWFRSTFAVDDELIDTHSCSLVRAYTLPRVGTLYVGRRHLCFAGGLLSGKVVIPLADVSTVTRAKHAFLFRDALNVATTTAGNDFFFVGFWALKHTLAQINRILKLHRLQSTASSSSARLSSTSSSFDAVAVDSTSSVDDFDENDNNNDDDDERAERALAVRLQKDESPVESFKVPAPLRILILTIGSRGDVQPTIMLGKRAARRRPRRDDRDARRVQGVCREERVSSTTRSPATPRR